MPKYGAMIIRDKDGSQKFRVRTVTGDFKFFNNEEFETWRQSKAAADKVAVIKAPKVKYAAAQAAAKRKYADFQDTNAAAARHTKRMKPQTPGPGSASYYAAPQMTVEHSYTQDNQTQYDQALPPQFDGNGVQENFDPAFQHYDYTSLPTPAMMPANMMFPLQDMGDAQYPQQYGDSVHAQQKGFEDGWLPQQTFVPQVNAPEYRNQSDLPDYYPQDAFTWDDALRSQLPEEFRAEEHHWQLEYAQQLEYDRQQEHARQHQEHAQQQRCVQMQPAQHLYPQQQYTRQPPPEMQAPQKKRFQKKHRPQKEQHTQTQVLQHLMCYGQHSSTHNYPAQTTRTPSIDHGSTQGPAEMLLQQHWSPPLQHTLPALPQTYDEGSHQHNSNMRTGEGGYASARQATEASWTGSQPVAPKPVTAPKLASVRNSVPPPAAVACKTTQQQPVAHSTGPMPTHNNSGLPPEEDPRRVECALKYFSPEQLAIVGAAGLMAWFTAEQLRSNFNHAGLNIIFSPRQMILLGMIDLVDVGLPGNSTVPDDQGNVEPAKAFEDEQDRRMCEDLIAYLTSDVGGGLHPDYMHK